MSEEKPQRAILPMKLQDIVDRANLMRDAFAAARMPIDNLTWPGLLLVAIHFGHKGGVPEHEARITTTMLIDLLYHGTTTASAWS